MFCSSISVWLSYFCVFNRPPLRHNSMRIPHHTGALVILGGVVVVLVPKFMHPSAGESDKPVFNSIYLISVVPMALSSVYKEMYARAPDRLATMSSVSISLTSSLPPNTTTLFLLLLFCPLCRSYNQAVHMSLCRLCYVRKYMCTCGWCCSASITANKAIATT